MKGDLKRKTRPQGQDERVFKQDGFGGGQNSDTPAKKIATNELALIRNAVAYRDRVEGGWGARIASDERYPGSGDIHDMQQHKVTGRWLLHRGGQLWLSAGRLQRDWEEVTPIGPDGSLSGSGLVTVQAVTMTGAAAANITAVVPSVFGQNATYPVGIAEGSGGSFTVTVYDSDGITPLCTYVGSAGDQPIVGAVATGGGGRQVVMDIDGVPNSGYGTIAGAMDVQETVVAVGARLRGLTLENTDNYKLYPQIVQEPDRDIIVKLYKDAGLTQLVASCVQAGASPYYFTSENDSGISGELEIPIPYLLADTYSDYTALEFEWTPENIEAASEIESYGESGFALFLRGGAPANIFVDQRITAYWFLGTLSGYPYIAITSGGGGTLQYRYLTTFVRIVDLETGEPAYTSNRTEASIAFEGPSNRIYITGSDYASYGSESAISSGSPMFVDFEESVGVGRPVTEQAAAYITHISIYRTADINNPTTIPDEYVWVADVPIYETSYSDTVTDELLLARKEANIDSPIYRLQSRGFVPMDKGVGCIREDFMFTAVDGAPSTSYCELFYAPRLIGYHNPLQRSRFQDPVSHIQKTAETMVVLCPSSVYQFTTSIYQDVGRGLSFIPIIGNRYQVSSTTGVSAANKPFPIDDSQFAAFCTDRTFRVFAGSQWGSPIDDLLVHKILENAETVVIGFVRGTALLWFMDGDRQRCLRYAFGGDPGNKWSEVERDSWPFASVAAIWEDDVSAIRLIVAGGDIPYVVEDESDRIYEDEVAAGPIVGPAAEIISNIQMTGLDGATLYGRIQYIGSGMYRVVGYQTVQDRNGEFDPVCEGDLFQPGDLPIEGYELAEVSASGISGTCDIAYNAAFLDYYSINFDYLLDGAGIVVDGYARIDSVLRFRDLAATQDSFRCFHKSSYASMLFPYGMPEPQIRATWYGDGVVKDQSVIVPANGSIQSFKRIDGNRIQLELEIRGSGWQIDGLETKYQTHDARNANGPQNGPEALAQAALAQNMLAWLNGASGLRNRVGGAFSGLQPDASEDPNGGMLAQDFSAPVIFATDVEVTDFSVMFWAKNPTTGIDPLAVAPFMAVSEGTPVAFLNFSEPEIVDCGSFQYTLPQPANDGQWHHYAVTRDTNTFRVFQDGVLFGESPTGSAGTSAVDEIIASAQNLFDPRIYSVRLSDEAIAYYYANGGAA